MDKMSIYNSAREVPKEAQKPITGGRLNGMTDISPMWRVKKMTELFGPAGIGWRFDPPGSRFQIQKISAILHGTSELRQIIFSASPK